MNIQVAKHAGFCFGVRRATQVAEDALRQGNGAIYTLGRLIHNDGYITQLQRKGMGEIGREDIDEICRRAQNLVATGQTIEKEFGIPIVNKRVSVTPISLVASASDTADYAPFAAALDKAAKTIGINFIGGFSALVQKGFTQSDRKLIASIPEALATTDLVCSSVNVGSTKAGINMDAVAEMGRVIKMTADRTAAAGGFGCAKLVVFANAVEDNPFMAGAFHGVGEPECVINVGVSGPGVVRAEELRSQPFVSQLADVDADIQSYFKTNDLRVDSRCYIVDDQSMIAMVACGRGFAIMPELMFKTGTDPHGCQVLRLEPAATRSIGLACLARGALSPAARQFAARARAYAASLRQK